MHCGAAQSVAIARGVRGHAPPPPRENFEIINCLRCILMHFQPKAVVSNDITVVL